MTLLSRWLLAAFTALLLLASPALAEPTPWPQAGSDLPADASVRFGTLPNGMRYAIKKNTTPTGGVSLRFRIDAGSLMERDDEQGLAHVLEHMAFRGSAHVADGDTVKILQSLGLTFGADTNAFTAATQTVYSFDMPKNDAASVDTALMLMREIAGELNIAQEALDTERNVVLAEAHLRDVPISHLRKSDLRLSLWRSRRLGADADRPRRHHLARHAQADPRFLPSLVPAGARHADHRRRHRSGRARSQDQGALCRLEGQGAAAPGRYRSTAPREHPAPVKLFAEAGVQPYIVFNWLRPYDASPDNKANEARDVLRFIALAVLNQRLAQLAHGANPPFIAASASHEHNDDVADVTEFVVSYRAGQALDGIKAAERAWRDAVEHGVRQDEVDQVVAQLRTFFQGNAAAAGTTPSAQVINSLLRSVDEKTVFTAPASDLALYEDVVKGPDGRASFRGAQIRLRRRRAAGRCQRRHAAARRRSRAAGRACGSGHHAAGRQRIGAAALALCEFRQGRNGRRAKHGRRSRRDLCPLRQRRDAHRQADAAARRTDSDECAFRKGPSRPAARSGGAGLGAGRRLRAGRLRRYSIDDLQKRMSDKQWGVSLSVGDDEFALTGQARAGDLDAELQVLAAYVTDPAWQPEAFDQTRIAYAGNYAETEASPSGVLSREFYGLLHGGDALARADPAGDQQCHQRWREGGARAGAGIGPARRHHRRRRHGRSGDPVGRGDVRRLAAARRRRSAGCGRRAFPRRTPQPVVLTHHGAANQAVAAIAWPTAGFFHDMKLQRTLRVLAEIFAQRLLDELRTREGITYTPGAASYSSLVSPDYGFVYALAQIPPDKIANFYAEVAIVADDLTATKVSDAELERARGPRIQDIQKQQQTNEYWLSLLAGSGQDPRLLDVIRSTLPDLKSVTAEDVQKAAQAWLKDDKAFLLVVVPPGSAPPARPR